MFRRNYKHTFFMKLNEVAATICFADGKRKTVYFKGLSEPDKEKFLHELQKMVERFQMK